MSMKSLQIILALGRTLLNAVLPESERRKVVNRLPFDSLVAHASLKERNGVFYFVPYQESKAFFQTNKFENNKKAAQRIATAVSPLLLKLLSDKNIDVIIPVPLGKQRRRERGFNQVEQLLAFSFPHNPRMNTTLLERVRETKPQADLTLADRQKNCQNAFAVKSPEFLHNKNVAVIDDIVTSGSTLESAARVLEKASGKSVVKVAFAG
jgi:ComF family protein